MSLDLRLMRYVIAVAEEGSFQDAADRLDMAQPPLSRQIRQLEQRLGVELFTRRPTRTTEAGRVFVESARRVLAAAADVVDHTRLVARGELGTVRLGYTVSTAYVEVPRLIAALAAEHPGLEVDGSELWDADLDRALDDRQLDASLGRGLPHRPGVAVETLRREPYVVVVGIGHRLAERGAARLCELRGDVFRFFPRHLAPTYYDQVLRAVGATGESFEVWENPVPGLRHLAVRSGEGFSLLPASIREWLPAGVTALDVVDDLPTIDLELLWYPETAPPGVKLLVDTAHRLAASEGWMADPPDDPEGIS